MSACEIDARLAELGIVLPEPPPVAGAYQPVVCRGGFGFVSGQFAFRQGRLAYIGRIGAELTPEEGRECAVLAALNALAQIRASSGGWQRFGGLCRLEGHVASSPDFVRQPAVLDGASELFVQVLGSRLGAHARTALHASRLPLDSPVELIVTFHLVESRG